MMMEEKEQPDEYISKSQRKRASHAAQQLGQKLVELPTSQLNKIDLPDRLREAICHAKTIKSHSAHKRQMQYIGRLMRDIDVQPIEQYMQSRQWEPRKETEKHHLAEQWRDGLINNFDVFFHTVQASQPTIDRQHIRQLVRNSTKEQKENKPPKSKRILYQYLLNLLSEANSSSF